MRASGITMGRDCDRAQFFVVDSWLNPHVQLVVDPIVTMTNHMTLGVIPLSLFQTHLYRNVNYTRTTGPNLYLRSLTRQVSGISISQSKHHPSEGWMSIFSPPLIT